jgi:hypothetical protein
MKFLVPAAAVVFAFCLVGCGPSINEIASKLQASMNEEFSKDSFYKLGNVASVAVNKDKGEYSGIAVIDFKDIFHARIDRYQANVIIKMDGSKITWVMAPPTDGNGIASLNPRPLGGTAPN